MTTQNAIKAMVKAGLKITQSGNRYFGDAPEQTISFIDQQGSAICLKVTAHGDVSDSQSDYSAGSYASSMKQALQWALPAGVS